MEKLKTITWSKDCWTHNFFRVWEFLFGREEGIRHESSGRAYRDEEGIVTQTLAFHTTEALLKHFEHMVRSLFKFEFVPVRVYIPLLQPIGAPSFSSPYLFAIAYSNSDKNTASSTTVSVTGFSVATTNGILFAVVNRNGSGYTFTGVTCTDGALAEIDHIQNPSHTDNNTGLWFSTGQTTASQTVTATATSGVLALDVASYSGAAQSSQPDSSNKGTASTGSSFALSTTVVASNCWLIMAGFNGNTTGGAVSGGTGTTVRQNDSAGGSLSDSNGTVSTGSQTLTLTKTGNDFWSGVIASFAPAVAAGPTNLKSLDGNVKSNIKSFMGNVLANIKSIAGNS